LLRDDADHPVPLVVLDFEQRSLVLPDRGYNPSVEEEVSRLHGNAEMVGA
jgi:hypothetical protein